MTILALLDYAIRFLLWAYGHKAVAEKVLKYTPLPHDAPSPARSVNPDITNHYGGI